MNNYLMLDGKKYELSPELVNALRSIDPVPKKKSSFQWDTGEYYQFIGSDGEVWGDTNTGANFDEKRHSVANYCADKALMEQRAMHETLNRLLWRYSEEHGGDSKWNGENDHWLILMDDGNIKVNYFCYSIISGVVYFKDKENALSAIEEIVNPFLAAHPDFVW